MSAALLAAAALTVAVGVAHSWLGERYLVSRLLRRSDLPLLFGGDAFTRATIRFAWHLTTAAWLGLAAVLLVLAGAPSGHPGVRQVGLAVAAAFVASAALALAVTRGRHLSWLVFLAIAGLILLAVG